VPSPGSAAAFLPVRACDADDLELVESGIIDSFALTKIVAALETAYAGLRVPDSDATVEGRQRSANRREEA
jgi:acyl carrier protein